MPPLPYSVASPALTLFQRNTNCDTPSSSACKPATPRQTIIIASVFSVLVILILLLAFWYWGCLCCLSRKRYQRVSKEEQTPGVPDAVAIGVIESAPHVGNKGGNGSKTQTMSGVGGGHTGGGSNNAVGGGGGGSGGSIFDCNVM